MSDIIHYPSLRCEKSCGGAARADGGTDDSPAMRAASLIGITGCIAINTTVNVATFPINRKPGPTKQARLCGCAYRRPGGRQTRRCRIGARCAGFQVGQVEDVIRAGHDSLYRQTGSGMIDDASETPLPPGEGMGEGSAIFGYSIFQDLFALRPSPVLADSATLCQGERGFSEATLGIELAQQSLAHDDIQGKLVEHVCQHTFKQLTRLDITRLLPSHGLLIRAGMLLVSLLMTAYICRQTAPWYIQQLPIQSSIDNDTAVAFNNDQRLILHAPHHVESVNSDTTLSLIMEANVSADELIANLQLAISINHLPPTCLPLPTAGTLMTADAKQYEHAISLSELNLNPGDQLALTARMQIRSANTSQWVESQPQVIHIQSIHESQSATITNAPSSFAANHQGSGQNQGNSGGSSSPAGHSNTSTNQTVSQHPMLPTIHTTNSLASGELVTPTTPSAPTITIESVPEVPLRYREMTNAYLTQLAIDSARTLTPNTTTPPSDGSTPP